MKPCGWPRCYTEIPREEWCCQRHWRDLTDELRQGLTASTYKPDLALYNELQNHIAHVEYARRVVHGLS